MSLDDRIRQLSETIIQEVRSPIEGALQRLLADVMTMAADDREQAVQSALTTAAAEREGKVAALREQLEREHDEKLATVRNDLASEHEAAVASAREALTREHEAGVAALREQLASEHEAAVANLTEQIDRERDAALANLRTEFGQERESAMANLRTALAQEHEAALARLREELAGEHETVLQAARDESARQHQAQLNELEARAEAERESAVDAVREELGRSHESALGAARAAAELAGGAALTAAVAHAEHARHEAEDRLAALEQELEQLRAETIQARQSSDDAGLARQDAAQARQNAELARQDAALARQDAELARQDAELARQDAAQARQDAEQNQLTAEQTLGMTHAADRQQELECSDRTLAAFRQLDESRSLTEVLRVLADQAATEIGRVAVLLVIGSRLRGWELRGLPDADPAAIDAPVEPGTMFGLAIARGLPVSTSEAPLGLEGDSLSALLATRPDRAGLAIPISVGGRVVAILYADGAVDRMAIVPSNWPEIAEILARHAGHCLEVLTISHASRLAGRVQQEPMVPEVRPSDVSPFADERREEESARRYARLLISEIKLYNEAAVEEGRSERNLLQRLGSDVERARRLYEEKIPEAVRLRVDCFDQEVIRTLAGGDPGLLGHT